jgi:hypothetical protein
MKIVQELKNLKGILMQQMIYDPSKAGDDFVNNKGKILRIRKYHLTDEEISKSKKKWQKEIVGIDEEIKIQAGETFFNPYRLGIYYYQIQTLYLLGANKWHSLTDIVRKLETYTSGIPLKESIVKSKGYHTAWDKFRGKSSRAWASVSKDYIGRIQENYIMLQRLSMMHPYGYKLHQVQAALDIKRVSKMGFEQGVYFYRLSTYGTQAEALPIKDFKDFTFPKHEGRYISRKFIGTIVTKDMTITEGQVVDHG